MYEFKNDKCEQYDFIILECENTIETKKMK